MIRNLFFSPAIRISTTGQLRPNYVAEGFFAADREATSAGAGGKTAPAPNLLSVRFCKSRGEQSS